jgi:hypothetical protein
MWWCKKYNRPLKDPLLQEYSYEELLYEMSAYSELQKSLDKLAEEEADRIEDEKYEEDLAWAEQMEKEFAAQQAPVDTPKPTDPSLDPANIEWMNKAIQEEKARLGEDFGEDLSFSMEDE